MRVLKNASGGTNHSDADCILIAVLSSGEEGAVYASDILYAPHKLWTSFTSEKCPTLAGIN